MNREPSPDRLAFQIARTTISSNYPGEELETLDHEVLVISADVPPQDGEIDEQRVERENANAGRAARRQQELATAAPAAGQHAGNARQGNDNIGVQAPAAPANHQHHEGHANRLRARDLLRDFERDGLEVYNSSQTNLGVALTTLTSLRTLLRYGVSKPMSASPLLRSKKEALDIVDRPQVPTPGVDQNVPVNSVVTTVPLSQ
jgi:hypothetical protein